MSWKLSPIEVNELSIRTRAMSEDEKRVVLKNLPTCFLLDEIRRRTDTVNMQYQQLFEILSAVSEDISLPEMQEILKNCRQTLKMD